MDQHERLRTFAYLARGVIDELADGTLTPEAGISAFFDYENIAYVDRTLRNKHAIDIMSRGVQLPDLFDILAPAVAKQELKNEIAKMRKACQKLTGRTLAAA